MSKTILISLPVTDLDRSIAFYQALGFVRNPQYSGEGAAFLVLSDAIQLVLAIHAEWRKLTTRPIPPPTSSEVGLALFFDDRAEVDAVHDAAVALGGAPDINPIEDLPFMYARDFTDPDGHIWGAKWIDSAALGQSSAYMADA